ncbi:MAG TPA: Jag N-terminal domain-containing protein [Candidatus Faecalibacterium gallistercoris]|uniref:RNA-binding protein KhpB n=1 Tax=Candidatus Faecalibacterium gallistercoris TaxID=2838579 RepID=A0A9D2JLS4_9FIRM|nr:Jag N-terminal domain-containing protein [Candidatus Faecalibacterium gallistercoris]
MIRSKEATGKTVEEARAAACAALGVSEDDLNVSYEVLEMPQSTGFLGLKKIPAKVRVIVEEEDPAPAAPEKPAVKVVRAEKAQPAEPAEKAEKAQPAPAPQPAEKPAPQPAPAQKPAAAPAAQAPAAAVTAAPAAVDETPVPIDIEANPKVKAAVEYLKEIVALMGVEDVTFSAVQKGEATIIRLDGDKMGALIGRRGETMESLSYLASLVANRMEGDYIKLGLDVAGYRGKRENDLTALAQKIGQKVRRSGRCFSMEPMNPYERRIIHSAISQMEGLRSESKGEGKDRHVVIYSTEPGAQTETYERRPRSGRDSRRGDNRGRRSGDRSERGSREGRRPRGDRSRGPRPSSVPERSFAPVDAASAAPVAPKRTQRVDDFADLDFGKIEL